MMSKAITRHINGIDKSALVRMLSASDAEQAELHKSARELMHAETGNKVYFRGLIEFSNLCAKDCFYCGIRRSNPHTSRYNLTDEQILEAARFAHREKFASIVLQAGELSTPAFTRRIGRLIEKIHRETGSSLRITLSLGEQSREIYRYWKECGADRYLLRIETSDPGLYLQLHPDDHLHSHKKRLEALSDLKLLGYQTGTGVMIGLPGQTMEHLADDLLFMRDIDIDMVGMGPYIEHSDTPLYKQKDLLWPLQQRFSVALNMIACLRLMMPGINIAAATALQAIDKMGREKAIRCGANVIMPNITPGVYRDSYKLYENKPCTDENADDCLNCLQIRVGMAGSTIGLGEWGDSAQYTSRTRPGYNS